MQFKQLRSLRVFVFLLLTIFFTDTVYASGMMVADQLCASHTVSTVSHKYDDHGMNQHENHKHDAGQKQSTNDHCSKYGHCMACFSVLPTSQFDNMQSQIKATTISLFEPSYLSHISARPQRPPIS